MSRHCEKYDAGWNIVLSWIEVVLFVGVAAAFGGFLQGLYRSVYSAEAKNRGSAGAGGGLGDLVVASLLGLGGGAAAILASVWLNKFSMEDSHPNKVYLIVLGVVAGFIGHRLLPRIARGLEERVAISEAESRLAIEEAGKAMAESRMAAKEARKSEEDALEASCLARLAVARSKDELRRLIPPLRELRERKPYERQPNLALGHVYKRLSLYEDAIAVMSTFLSAKRDRGELDKDYSDALYNRACYRVLKAVQPPRNEDLLNQGLADLQEAIRLDDGNKQDAWDDPDFSLLRNERFEPFYRLVDQQLP